MQTRKKKFIKLFSDDYDGQIMTQKAYIAVCLTMSSGDHGAHRIERVLLTEKEIAAAIDKDQILWHVTHDDALEDFFQYIRDTNDLTITAESYFENFIGQDPTRILID